MNKLIQSPSKMIYHLGWNEVEGNFFEVYELVTLNNKDKSAKTGKRLKWDNKCTSNS